MLKKILFLIVAAISLAACSQPDAHDSHGKAIYLNHYKGKWIVINYWAVWCKPCLEEMPALNKLSQQLKDKVFVLGVSYDQLSNAEINKIVKKMNLHYPLTSSFPLSRYGQSQPGVLPITYIINPQGKLVKTLKGPQTRRQFVAAIS